MPTENERKYVLRLNCEQDIKIAAGSSQYICQGYLTFNKGVSLRVRKTEYTNKPSCYQMTYKHTVKKRTIEVETDMDQRDFDDLWTVTFNRLEKWRYKIKDAKGQVWEIDFFRDHHDHTYFAMAEIEMPEGQESPEMIPGFIRNNLVYEVPLSDNRFASKLVADVRYAKDLLKSLEEDARDGDEGVQPG